MVFIIIEILNVHLFIYFSQIIVIACYLHKWLWAYDKGKKMNVILKITTLNNEFGNYCNSHLVTF